MVNHIFIARIFLIGLGAIAIYMGVSNKSPDEVSLIPCLFHSVTDVPCPGCGMTRACLSLTHGHLTDALRYHPFSIVILVLAIGTAFFPTQLSRVWTRFTLKTRNRILILGIVLCLSVWLMKLRDVLW